MIVEDQEGRGSLPDNSQSALDHPSPAPNGDDFTHDEHNDISIDPQTLREDEPPSVNQDLIICDRVLQTHELDFPTVDEEKLTHELIFRGDDIMGDDDGGVDNDYEAEDYCRGGGGQPTDDSDSSTKQSMFGVLLIE